jgi:acylpyruvate hydrolase
MRFVTYASGADWRPGILVGDKIVDAATAAQRAGRSGADVAQLLTTRNVLELGAGWLTRLTDAATDDGAPSIPLAGTRLGPPVPDPSKIVCLGLNYRDHAEEAGLTPPAAPMFFAKFANSLAGPADAIVAPATTRQVDYEAEMAVVIGQSGRDIAEADALGHVFGVMALNDVSARDLQLANQLWTGGKAIDTFAPCGPALVSLDEVGDIQNLRLRTLVNGEVVQDGTTAQMIFGVSQTIAFLSKIMTLEVGDIIATGTPAGVGMSRSPQQFLVEGDRVDVELAQVGTLSNVVARH